MNRLCPKCRASCNDDQEYCAECGAVLPSLQEYVPPTNYNNTNTNENDAPATELPMKWYKFVIYFQLFASAALNFYYGFRYLGNGLDYDIGRLTWYGIFTVGIGIWALVVRSKLKNFKENAPKQYYFYLFSGIILNLLFSMQPMAELLGSAIGTGIVVACNVVYFNKRKHLFVN